MNILKANDFAYLFPLNPDENKSMSRIMTFGECVDCGSLNKIENHYLMLCAGCAHARRKAERQAKQVKIVSAPRKVSAKMAKDLQDYSVQRRQYLAGHTECEARVAPDCDGDSCEIHHSAKRGSNLLNIETFVAVCRPCHIYIETVMSAEERRERGLLISKTNETI